MALCACSQLAGATLDVRLSAVDRQRAHVRLRELVLAGGQLVICAEQPQLELATRPGWPTTTVGRLAETVAAGALTRPPEHTPDPTIVFHAAELATGFRPLGRKSIRLGEQVDSCALRLLCAQLDDHRAQLAVPQLTVISRSDGLHVDAGEGVDAGPVLDVIDHWQLAGTVRQLVHVSVSERGVSCSSDR